MAKDRVNITPLLDHLFRVGDIKTKEDLQMLIKALREKPDEIAFDPKFLADVMKKTS